MKIYGIELPDTLHPETEGCIRAILKEYESEGLIDIRDSIAWRMLAVNLNFFFSSEEEIYEKGLTRESKQKNMAISSSVLVNSKFQSMILPLLKELGLTPASRAKIRKTENTEEEPLFARFIKREAK